MSADASIVDGADAATMEMDAVAATVMFVDDESNILNSLRRLFRSEGYTILLANSGAEGLELFQQQPVDLVVSDMRMPGMSGDEFLEKVAIQWPDTVRILLTGYADIESTVSAINKGSIYKYISKPWEDNDLKLSVRRGLEQRFLEQERRRLQLLTQRQNEELKDLNSNLEQKVEERTEELHNTLSLLESAHEELKKNYTIMVKMFSGIIEMRNSGVAGHSRRVAGLSMGLAKRMGMSDEEVQSVLFSALLHNITQVGMPDHLLEKPYNALATDEREIVSRCLSVGQGLLMGMTAMHDAATYIRGHRERWDGRGIPDGLQGNGIPLGARILAVANDYDEIQIGALYSEKVSAHLAREYLLKNRGKLYDPAVVDAFIDDLDDVPQHVEATSDRPIVSGELAEGMELARDLITRDGVMLLPHGSKIDEKTIQSIRRFETSAGEHLDIFITLERW